MSALLIQRLSLVANTTRAVLMPGPCSAVTILNAGADDIKVYSTLDDETTQVGIAAGWSQVFPLPPSFFAERGKLQAVFFLKAPINMEVALQWVRSYV